MAVIIRNTFKPLLIRNLFKTIKPLNNIETIKEIGSLMQRECRKVRIHTLMHSIRTNLSSYANKL